MPRPFSRGTVGHLPGLRACIEDPLLQSCGGLRSSMGVEIGATGVTISFIRKIQSVGVCKPEAEGKGDTRRGLCERGWETGKDTHVARQAVGPVESLGRRREAR